jgi:Flp pilus assembly protein TadD
LAHYRKALELVHKDHLEYDWAHANLANLLIKLGDDRQAFQFAAEAAHRNPNSPRNFFLGGKALAKLNRHELAVKWLRRAVELDANYPEPRYLLAQTLRKLGRNEEAQRELKAFQELQARIPRDRR